MKTSSSFSSPMFVKKLVEGSLFLLVNYHVGIYLVSTFIPTPCVGFRAVGSALGSNRGFMGLNGAFRSLGQKGFGCTDHKDVVDVVHVEVGHVNTTSRCQRAIAPAVSVGCRNLLLFYSITNV